LREEKINGSRLYMIEIEVGWPQNYIHCGWKYYSTFQWFSVSNISTFASIEIVVASLQLKTSILMSRNSSGYILNTETVIGWPQNLIHRGWKNYKDLQWFSGTIRSALASLQNCCSYVASQKNNFFVTQLTQIKLTGYNDVPIVSTTYNSVKIERNTFCELQFYPMILTFRWCKGTLVTKLDAVQSQVVLSYL